MACKVTFEHELSKHSLFQHGGMNIDETSHFQEWLHQRWRQDQVTDSKRRKKNLAEGADIDDTVCIIEPLEGGQRTSPKTELTVVIIFKDIGIGALCPVQKCQPPRERH